MNWQDILFSVGGAIFMVFLWGSFRTPPARITSIPTGLVLSAYAVAYVCMGFWYSAVITGMTSATWIGLGFLGPRRGN